jgi:hypothetical protein
MCSHARSGHRGPALRWDMHLRRSEQTPSCLSVWRASLSPPSAVMVTEVKSGFRRTTVLGTVDSAWDEIRFVDGQLAKSGQHGKSPCTGPSYAFTWGEQTGRIALAWIKVHCSFRAARRRAVRHQTRAHSSHRGARLQPRQLSSPSLLSQSNRDSAVLFLCLLRARSSWNQIARSMG